MVDPDGPTIYEAMGGADAVLATGRTRRWTAAGVAAFAGSLDGAGIPNDPELRFQLIAWFTWATAALNHGCDPPRRTLLAPCLPLISSTTS